MVGRISGVRVYSGEFTGAEDGAIPTAPGTMGSAKGIVAVRCIITPTIAQADWVSLPQYPSLAWSGLCVESVFLVLGGSRVVAHHAVVQDVQWTGDEMDARYEHQDLKIDDDEYITGISGSGKKGT